MRKILNYILFVLLFTGCSTSKFIPKGGHVLEKVEVKVDSKRVSKSAIEGVIQQKPIKNVLGIPFGLWFYSLSDSTPPKTRVGRWINRTIQNTGQPPVVFDSLLYANSMISINQYLKTKGYYDSKVTNEVVYKKDFATIRVQIETGHPYRIGSFSTSGEDSTIVALVKKDSTSSIIHPGMIFDTDMLEKEREKVTSYLKNNGYFFFNKNYLVYEADSTVGNKTVNIRQIVRNIVHYNPLSDSVGESNHQKYIVKEVNVFTNFDRVEAFTDKNYMDNFHEKKVGGLNIWSNGKSPVSSNLVLRAVKIRPDELYNQANRIETDNNLSMLKVFRSIEIQYDTLAVASAKTNRDSSLVYFNRPNELICNIYLTPLESQSYKLEGEMFISSEYWGTEGTLGYTHRNLFKNAELFNVNINGTIPFKLTSNSVTTGDLNRSTEFGITSSINIPRFLVPFNLEDRLKLKTPRTQFSVGYNYQSRTIYTRKLITFGFGYTWNVGKNLSISYSPINLNIIKMYDADSLQKILKDQQLVLETAFSDHFVSSGKLGFTYNSQKLNSLNSYLYSSLNIESAGNALSLLNPLLQKEELTDGVYSHYIWGMQYSQYLSAELTTVYNARLDSKNRLVYRFQFGIAFPYGNTSYLPYERYFFIGGANSMRGWQVRGMGPESYAAGAKSTGLLNIGDLKLEANVEYRFKLFWNFEGALFLDAGNVWFMAHNKFPREMTFYFNSFYKQVAANTGLGLRLNLGYLIARFDAGFRMIDPSKPDGKHFLPANGFSRSDISYHIGIGYPF